MRLIFGLLLFIRFLSSGQNLVPNSGFEEYLKCPHDYNTIGHPIPVPYWFSPSSGTPDYFNECSTHNAKARINWAGYCPDYSGKGYAGIMTYMDKRQYREYLSVELLAPLDSGVLYSLQFSFRLSSYSQISSGNIGLALTDNPVRAGHDKMIALIPALLAMKDSAIVRRTGGWQIASGDYLARGGERYLTIGNFSESNLKYRIKFGGNHEPMLQYASFYFIDDVVVQPQLELMSEVPPVIMNENPFEMDSLIVLKNVQFAYNKFSLNKAGKAELDRLLNFLSLKSNAQIEIYGHTDDQGPEDFNRQLSLNRARAVADYLNANGIAYNRMKYYGYGKSLPLVDATNETARSINRRVEVQLVK